VLLYAWLYIFVERLLLVDESHGENAKKTRNLYLPREPIQYPGGILLFCFYFGGLLILCDKNRQNPSLYLWLLAEIQSFCGKAEIFASPDVGASAAARRPG
jgi:hypothetical protein